MKNGIQHNYVERARRKRLVLDSEGIVAYDSFHRADSDLLILSDTGEEWIIGSNWKFGIRNNAATSIETTTASYRPYFVSSISDGRLSCKFINIAQNNEYNNGLIFRAIDTSSHLVVYFSSQAVRLARRLNSALSILSQTNVSISSNMFLKIIFEGLNVKVLVDDNLVLEQNVSDFTTEEGYGIYQSNVIPVETTFITSFCLEELT